MVHNFRLLNLPYIMQNKTELREIFQSDRISNEAS